MKSTGYGDQTAALNPDIVEAIHPEMISDMLRAMTENLRKSNERKGKRQAEKKTVTQAERHIGDSLAAVGGDQTKLEALLAIYVFKVGEHRATFAGFARYARNQAHRTLEALDFEFWTLNGE